MLLFLLNAFFKCGCIPAPLGNGITGVASDLLWVDVTITISASLAACSCAVAKYLHTEDIYSLPLSSDVPTQVLGGLFAFLLTFRSAQSYARWFEGRGHAGAIMAECRYLAIVINGASAQLEETGDCDTKDSNELKKNANRLFRALYRACVLHVRGYPDNQSLGEHLNEREQTLINAPTVGARPLLIMKWIISELKFLNKELVISDYRATLATCSRITTRFNGADKICNTPNPNVMAYLLFVAYTVLMWWLFPWRLAVKDDAFVMAVLSAFLYAYVIGCLIFVAGDMDNPFDGGTIDLPLEKYEGGLCEC